MPWWTVFAVYADNEEGYVHHIQAPDVAAAKAKAYREAESVILIAGVVAGKVDAVEEPTHDVTPLRGRGHAIVVSSVHVTERKIVVPSRCPNCKSDLRKPHAIMQGDLVLRTWNGHLTKAGDSVAAEKDQPSSMRGNASIEAARLRCPLCRHDFWNGLRS